LQVVDLQGAVKTKNASFSESFGHRSEATAQTDKVLIWKAEFARGFDGEAGATRRDGHETPVRRTAHRLSGSPQILLSLLAYDNSHRE